jgi:rubrerythrin
MGILGTLADAVSSGERGASRYDCRNCGRTFAYRADLDAPACPYCDARLADADE